MHRRLRWRVAPHAHTPNLDGRAAEGVRFENFHVAPLCTPTRVELMTGVHNGHNYVQFGRLPKAARNFGHLVREAGFATAFSEHGNWVGNPT